LDLRRRPMRARVRRPASLGHPRAARLPKAAHPLVTGRPRHTVPLAELRHRPLAAFEVLREPQPLFRRTRLHPGHLLGVNDVPGLLLTMCPGRTMHGGLTNGWSSLAHNQLVMARRRWAPLAQP